ncbi:MAG: GNAT family N-acetyltransferase [Firmicutes bacterium]|nr:GNAT family N-acetyltransferase [Bacillota bacterium]
MMKIRKATHEDILDIQQVAHITWHTTYERTMRPDTRANILAEFYSEESLASSLNNDKTILLVAELEGCIVGFAQALPHPCSGYEVTRIYILPSYQRQGIGAHLLAELSQALSGQCLWAIVEKDNQPALNFYQKHGFVQRRELQLPLFGETLPFVELTKQ